jgi:MoxR-like ATPase
MRADTGSPHPIINAVLAQVEQVILGKTDKIKLALTCLLAGGHLLLEDLPGVGKTTLAHALAASFGFSFTRIQFTSDMLPADILGVSIFDQRHHAFSFHPGPIFSHFVLADEVNRATPKTQSALLEAMEEKKVSLEGETHKLPEPFFVIATQNPSYQIGTFPLPESQLDRFLMRLNIGYPDAEAEQALLKGNDRRVLLDELQPCSSVDELKLLQQQVQKVHASDDLVVYLQTLLRFSRESELFDHGLSPRAGIALLQAAKAWTVLNGGDFVTPETLQLILPHVVMHRLRPAMDTGVDDEVKMLDALLSVAIP